MILRETSAHIYTKPSETPPLLTSFLSDLTLPPLPSPPTSSSSLHNKLNNVRTYVMPPLLFLLLLSLPSLFPLGSAQNPGPTGPYYNTSYSPSFAIIIAILVAALFLTGVFSIYFRHCGRSSSSSSLPLQHLAPRPPRGLDPTIIQSFPTLDYSTVKIHKIGKEALECAICLNEFDDSQTLRLIPKCDHVFHPQCIDQWLQNHTTCPVCRSDLTVVPEPPTEVSPAGDSEIAAVPEVDRKVDGGRAPVWWARSRSAGESTERYTLRLPADVRNRLLNERFHRATSLVVLPRESSVRRGFRSGGGGGGRFSRRLSRRFRSDRWVFTMTPPFLVRASSVRSPKVAASGTADVEERSCDAIVPPSAVDSSRPPV